MGRLLILCAALALGAGSTAQAAIDTDVSIDLRIVDSSGLDSYLNGGLGKLRFDPRHDGLRIGELRFGLRAPVVDDVDLTVEAATWGDHDANPVDLLEAVLDWRPLPHGPWKSQLRAGAFYAPVSLENRMRGWRSPYMLSSSAINTWVGEELRTIGLEYDLTWLGPLQGHDFEVELNAAAFGWNDPAGIVLALRGWSVHDRQTTLFGRVGQPGQGLVDGRTLFYSDIDKRVGFYAGTSLKWRGLIEVRALRYDNRGDPAIAAPAIRDWSWDTRFNSVGVRITPHAEWTLIWQGMRGTTAAQQPLNKWLFDSQFGLVSWHRGAHRLSARGERFSTDHVVTTFGASNSDRGSAWTAAYTRELSTRASLTLEQLWIRSRLPLRASLGEPVLAAERQLQLALRLEL